MVDIYNNNHTELPKAYLKLKKFNSEVRLVLVDKLGNDIVELMHVGQTSYRIRLFDSDLEEIAKYEHGLEFETVFTHNGPYYVLNSREDTYDHFN